MILPPIEIPAAALATSLVSGFKPPMTPPNEIEPVPASMVKDRGVESLLIVLEKDTAPVLVLKLKSVPKVTAPVKVIFPEVFVVVE